MFKREFKVIHIFESNNDCVESYYLKGKRKDVKKGNYRIKKESNKICVLQKDRNGRMVLPIRLFSFPYAGDRNV